MPREPVESSLIRAVGYDVPSSILEVELAEDGVVYDYFDVPFSAYTELMEAESKGAYYNDFIKDLYAFRKREPEAEPSERAQGRSWPARQIALEREIAVYGEHLPEFLKEHEGQYVLIYRDEILGFWPSEDEALEVGYERFGLVPLLVKQVLAEEPVFFYSRSI